MQSNESEALFECHRCGQCCKGFGGTYVTDADIEAIAEFTGISPLTLLSKYCRRSGTRYVLAQREDRYCIFWNELCTIHPVKPAMCRKWPYIESVLIDVQNWHTMAAFCPGMRTDVLSGDIIATVKKMLGRERKVGSMRDR